MKTTRLHSRARSDSPGAGQAGCLYFWAESLLKHRALMMRAMYIRALSIISTCLFRAMQGLRRGIQGGIQGVFKLHTPMNTPLNTPTVKSLLVSFYECRHTSSVRNDRGFLFAFHSGICRRSPLPSKERRQNAYNCNKKSHAERDACGMGFLYLLICPRRNP